MNVESELSPSLASMLSSVESVSSLEIFSWTPLAFSPCSLVSRALPCGHRTTEPHSLCSHGPGAALDGGALKVTLSMWIVAYVLSGVLTHTHARIHTHTHTHTHK